MERSTAIKKLTKLLGKSLAYRVNPKAPTPEEREAAKADLPAAIAERDKLKEKRDARYKAVLEADAEYQSLRSAHTAASERTHSLYAVMRTKKITVGTTNSMFFLVKADGDSWEEVIEKLEEKQKASS